MWLIFASFGDNLKVWYTSTVGIGREGFIKFNPAQHGL